MRVTWVSTEFDWTVVHFVHLHHWLRDSLCKYATDPVLP